MSFNFESVFNDMIGAVKENVSEEWDDISAYAKEVFEKEKEFLKNLADLRLCGDIDDDELDSEIKDEEKTLEAQLKAILVMKKAMAQKAVNAAINVLCKAIKAAL